MCFVESSMLPYRDDLSFRSRSMIGREKRSMRRNTGMYAILTYVMAINALHLFVVFHVELNGVGS